MKYLTDDLRLMIFLTILGCAQNSDSISTEIVDEEVIPTTEQKDAETIQRKLIKKGRFEFETDDLKSTRKIIFEAVDRNKGYISSDQEFELPGRQSNTVVVRVPADNFDGLVNDVTQGVGKFESKEINVKDVTEEFLDVQARLRTKKELERRLLALLDEAKNVTEVLEIEKQIGQLRADIESIEGRLKYLENRVLFSELTLVFYEKIQNKIELSQKLKGGFKNGWNSLILFFVALTNIWPFIIIGLAILIGMRIYRRNK